MMSKKTLDICNLVLMIVALLISISTVIRIHSASDSMDSINDEISKRLDKMLEDQEEEMSDEEFWKNLRKQNEDEEFLRMLKRERVELRREKWKLKTSRTSAP